MSGSQISDRTALAVILVGLGFPLWIVGLGATFGWGTAALITGSTLLVGAAVGAWWAYLGGPR